MAKLAKFVSYFRLAKPPLVSPKNYVVPLAVTRRFSCTRQLSTIISSISSRNFLSQRSQNCIFPARYMSTDPKELCEIEDRVYYNLRLYDKIDHDKLSNGSHFIKDLGLDSLDHVEIILAMEDEFGYYIPDNDAEKLLTPQEIIDYLADKLDVFD